MTQAVAVRRDGDAFQARIFWRKAARLLDPESPIVRVGFETGPKGFDDIWIEYRRDYGVLDQEGRPLLREHLQCKWHVSPDSYGHAEVIDPSFINANARSLLQRAFAAQQSYAPDGYGVWFRLVTNWRIDRKDLLKELIHTRSHTLRLDRLFGTATDDSGMGRLRKLWRDHLGIDDTQLRLLARTLGFSEATDSLEDLRDALDPLFRIVGLRRVPAHQSAFIYDEVAFRWLAQGRLVFDRDGLRTACEREDLIDDGRRDASIVYGVKSFEHPVDRLEDRCVAVLDLVPDFDDRFIRSEADWATVLYPALRAFLLDAATKTSRLRLSLDAHLTLAFAAGSVLNIKSGKMIELEQRTIGRSVWSADDVAHDPSWPHWNFQVEALPNGGQEMAVAIGLTHEIASAVRSYVASTLPAIGSMLVAQLSTGVGARSVAAGRHAFELAEVLTAKVRALRSSGAPQGMLHLFMAGPGSFAFLLGQRQGALGKVTLYEFNFEGVQSGSYKPSLAIPVSDKVASIG